MRKHLRRLVSLCAETLPMSDPLYEFGALQPLGIPEVEDLRTFFPGRKYVGSDMRSGPGVDILLDLHALDLPDNSVGTALCLDVVEHVEYPRQAMAELYRVLHPDGILILTSVMNFPIHSFPNDYWRFTPEGFRSLLKPFPVCFIGFDGPADFPQTVVGLGCKNPDIDLSAFHAGFLAWQARCNLIARKINGSGQ